jgi:hypothetical protein
MSAGCSSRPSSVGRATTRISIPAAAAESTISGAWTDATFLSGSVHEPVIYQASVGPAQDERPPLGYR